MVAGLLGLGIALGSCGAWKAIQDHVFAGEAQGTTYSIKVSTMPLSGEARSLIQQTITGRLSAIDLAMSTYRPDSEISRFNQWRATTPFRVSPELVRLFTLAREVSEASGGAFDVTVAPLVNAWGFGPGGRTGRTPGEGELDALRPFVGYAKVEIDVVASTLRKTDPGIICDLNAIAQGFTVDAVAADLEALGYDRYMVEVGGEVKARGTNARGNPWRVGIERPSDSDRGITLVVEPDGHGLATSGDYHNYYEIGGLRISHHIDPRSGRPITNTLASVSVIHPQCGLADAYATALTVLGPEAGMQLAKEKNLAVFMVVHTGPDAGSFTEKRNSSFERFVSGAQP